jgi:hypothetical protein
LTVPSWPAIITGEVGAVNTKCRRPERQKTTAGVVLRLFSMARRRGAGGAFVAEQLQLDPVNMPSWAVGAKFPVSLGDCDPTTTPDQAAGPWPAHVQG